MWLTAGALTSLLIGINTIDDSIDKSDDAAAAAADDDEDEEDEDDEDSDDAAENGVNDAGTSSNCLPIS